MDALLRGLPYFLEVARQESFSRASEALDVPLPSVSRRIAALEKQLGVRLLHRTTRSVSLTESGKIFYEGCDYILSELDMLRDRVIQNETGAAGRLRISVPADIYFQFLQGVFGDFTRLHPGIELQVLFTTRWVDLYKDPFDLEIRVGPLPDSDLKVRTLATMRTNIHASTELLQHHPMPQTPRDLEKFPFIWLYQIEHTRLDLQRGEKTEAVIVRPAHLVSNIGLSLELMLAGQGVSLLQEGMAEPFVREGRIVRLLPEWHTPPVNISAVMATARVPQRIRIFIDYLAAHFARIGAAQR